MKEKIHVPVRLLVEQTLRSGDLNAEFSGPSRLADAIRAHQKVQKSRSEDYTREAPVSHTVETDLFILEIGGRIDGVFHYPDRVIVEEIKTTVRDLDAFDGYENRIHWGQAQTYAYIYAALYDLYDIEVQLVYYNLNNEQTREYRRHFTRDDLETFFQGLIARFLERAAILYQWRQTRNASLKAMNFPFPGYRPGQRRMAVDVYLAVKNNVQLMVQAPTGIGKTMAAVFPVMKALAEELTPKVFYLTARTTGRTVAENALDELRSQGARIKSVTLTAKEKMCFDDRVECLSDVCGFAKGHYDRIDSALDFLLEKDALTRDVIEEAARQHRVCPFELSLDAALAVDIVICDYNYVFDPKVYLKRFFNEPGGNYTFLIDEAHNLVDRGRYMFSAELYKKPFLDLRRMVKTDDPELYKTLGRINAWMLEGRKKCEETGQARAEKVLPEDLIPLLKKFISRAERLLKDMRAAAFQEALVDLYFEVTGFLRIAGQYDESYVSIFEQAGRDLRVKLFCMNPAGGLRRSLKRCTAAVFFSATLTPIHYFKTVFGCEETARELALPSPFPAENLCLLVSDRISTLYRKRDQTKAQIARAISTLVRNRKGNYLLYLPSYKYLTMVREVFIEDNPDIDSIVQTPNMTEQDREIFLDRFNYDNPETLVGFAVMGGIFGEAIDLVGDRLNGAVIVGVGLPGICPERELIREHFTRTHGAGFEYAYLYPGLNRVCQAAGRVIRSEADRGVVFLIDERYGTYRYKSLLPREWQPVTVADDGQAAEVVSQFWNL